MESPTYDSDSDLDLDIQELSSGPMLHAGQAPSRKSKENRRAEYDQSGHIALRSLRMGGLRGFSNRHRNLDSSRRNYTEEDEDLHGLLNDEDGESSQRMSAGQPGHDDDAPL